MELVLLSDTHGRHGEVEIPNGDVLIHAGDFGAWFGTMEELEEFNDFLGQLPHAHKIVVAGNHDFCFERANADARKALTNAHYLQDESLEIDGVKFYGSPWQPEFLNLAFNLRRGEPLRRKWEMVPPDTDVLITHGPPHGIGDETLDGLHVGCEELLLRVKQVKPRVHVFGHIHEGRGKYEIEGTVFVNAVTNRAGRSPFLLSLTIAI
ncbi:MAG: metallophosphatase domain-containing protein [Candidatus Krumholzibacteria bacterium]|nr:metallophosphatase domain-containing protein [Candidatus Krumholzibacteria bacterium]